MPFNHKINSEMNCLTVVLDQDIGLTYKRSLGFGKSLCNVMFNLRLVSVSKHQSYNWKL